MLLGGCASVRNVGYFDAVAARPLANVERVYIDAHGSLYPETPLPSLAVPPADWDGSLFNWFTTGEGTPCEMRDPGADIASLCAAGKDPSQWYGVQDSMWRERGVRIAEEAAKSPDPEIVLFIHGFNNTMAEAAPNYSMAREMILASVPLARRSNLHFVEVYWDGCSVPGGLGCWAKGQGAGPLAGFALRQLLNSIDDRMAELGKPARFRVITHSSGAFVMGAALGNPGEVLPNLRDQKGWEYARFADHAKDETGAYRIPDPDEMRLAMFAPATPVQTFTGLGPEQGLRARDVRLLYTVHPGDMALSKTKGIHVGCEKAGVTCMGARTDLYCDLVKKSAKLDAHGTVRVAYDFTRPSDAHAFAVYLDQAKSPDKSIIADLMTDGALARTGEVPCPD
jgi:hypothetical protein